MQRRRPIDQLRHPWVVWLALCLALLGALLPTLSHALVWARGDASKLIEVCTSNGPRWMALPAAAGAADGPSAVTSTPGSALTESATASGPDPRGPASAAVLEHCPFCLLMADRLAPPPAPQLCLFTAPGHAVVPAPPPVVFVPAQAVSAALARGPPTR